MNECWVDFGCFVLGADIQCTQTGERIFVDCCSGCMGNASVINPVFGGDVLTPSWLIVGSGEPSVRPSTILVGSTYVK